jgi:FAD/FMN-containing dehydrogenase
MSPLALFFALAALLGAALASPGGLHWASWNARQVCQPLDVFLPRAEAELVGFVAAAAQQGERVKVVGAGHSFSSIALTTLDADADGTAHMVSLDRLDQLHDVRRGVAASDSSVVVVGAGIRIRALNDLLAGLGLALENMGATCAQSIAGATATGTHGTGGALGSLSTQIVGMRLLTADGAVLDVDARSQPALFAAARVGLGALGIVMRVALRVVDAFRLRLDTTPMPLDELLKQLCVCRLRLVSCIARHA